MDVEYCTQGQRGEKEEASRHVCQPQQMGHNTEGPLHGAEKYSEEDEMSNKTVYGASK